MKQRNTALAAILFVVALIVLTGCQVRDRYTYPQIRAEYAASPAAPQPSGTATEAQTPLMPISGPLALDDAVRIALANNPDMAVSTARIRQSEAMIAEAAAAFWPTVGLYGEYVQGDAPSAYLFKKIDQRMLPPQVDFNAPGWFENYEVGVQGRINLFSGGRDYLRKRMAETGLEVERLDHLSIENALVSSVIEVYFDTLAAAEFLSIALQSVETVKAQLHTMEIRYRGGSVLKSDILSLEVRLAQAREERIRAESNLSLSEAALANLLGHDPDTPIELPPAETLDMEVPGSYTAALGEALANRPELKKMRRQIVQSRMAVDAVKSEYLPRLDAQGRYYFDDPGLDFETDRENWTLGLMLSWELFTGFATKARVQEAHWALRELLAADRKATQSIQLDLKRAYLALSQAKARHDVTLAAAAQAEEALRIVRQQYEGGSVSVTRYLDAELALNRARMLSRSAYYDKEKAVCIIGRALGRWVHSTEEGT